jgi:hypothetical protein
MLKLSITYHLRSTSLANEDGQTTYSLILTAITYGLSLRSSGKSLARYRTTDSNNLLSLVLRRIGRTTMKELKPY